MPFWLVFWAKISSKKLCVLLRFLSAYIKQALKHILLLHIQPFKKLRVCKSALTGAGVAEGGGRGPLPHPLPDRWQADKFTPISAREDLTVSIHALRKEGDSKSSQRSHRHSAVLPVSVRLVRLGNEEGNSKSRQCSEQVQQTKQKKHREPPKRFPCA